MAGIRAWHNTPWMVVLSVAVLFGIGTASGAQNFDWRGPGADGVFPATDLVTSFNDTSNVVWKCPLPNYGTNTPVCVGDRVFALCDPGWPVGVDAPQLLCVSATDGKVLWQQSVDNLDARPEKEAAEARAFRASEFAFARRSRELLVAYRAAEDDAARQAIVDKAAAEGMAFSKGRFSLTADKMVFTPACLDKQRVNEYRRLESEGLFAWEGWYYAGNIYTGQTYPSVTSDGTCVYAFTNLNAVACFTLDGTRKWLVDIKVTHPRPHGSGAIVTASPILVGDKVIVFRHHSSGGTVVALDKASGAERWRVSLTFSASYSAGSTPVRLTLDGEEFVYVTSGDILRVADGKIVGKLEHPDPKRSHGTYFGNHGRSVGKGDMLYILHGGNGGGANRAGPGVYAWRLRRQGDGVQGEMVWSATGGGENNSSLVLYENRLYSLDLQKVFDAATGEVVADLKQKRVSKGNNGPIIADGKLIVLKDAGEKTETPGCMVEFFDAIGLAKVGEGKLFTDPAGDENRAKRMARVAQPLWPWGRSGISAWGNRIFVRSYDALYCIGNPEQPLAARTTVQQP